MKIDKKTQKLLEIVFKIAGGGTFFLFAVIVTTDFIHTHRPSALLILLHNFLCSLFFIARKPETKEVNLSLRDWFVAMASLVLYNFILPAPHVNEIFGFQMLQVLGTCVFLGGILSLNRSFAVVAGNRGIKTTGLYKYLRHPLYAAYFLECIGFLGQNMTGRNLILAAIWTLIQIKRLLVEEEYLSRDQAYVDYKKHVRWRLLPGVF